MRTEGCSTEGCHSTACLLRGLQQAGCFMHDLRRTERTRVTGGERDHISQPCSSPTAPPSSAHRSSRHKSLVTNLFLRCAPLRSNGRLVASHTCACHTLAAAVQPSLTSKQEEKHGGHMCDQKRMVVVVYLVHCKIVHPGHELPVVEYSTSTHACTASQLGCCSQCQGGIRPVAFVQLDSRISGDFFQLAKAIAWAGLPSRRGPKACPSSEICVSNADIIFI